MLNIPCQYASSVPLDSDLSLHHSLNVLKIYQAVARHIQLHPEDASRFPNFSQPRKTILARGVDHPLEGELHSAQYFHGRYVLLVAV